MTAATLGELLKPCAEEDFLDQSYGTSYRYVAGWPGKFSDVLSWARLNEILDSHHRDWLHPETDGAVTRNRLGLVLRGEPLPPASFFRDVPGVRGGTVSRLDPARLNHLIRRGASLTIDGVDELHEPIGALAEGLERTLHEPVRVNLYASWRSTPAIDRHWDTKDTFIAQVSGRKHWQVYAPTRQFPVREDLELTTPPVDEPVWEHVLDEGDLLYLPRGWWHIAAAVDGPSLHLTFGVFKRTGLELLDWLRSELRESEEFRRDLPRFASPAERAAHLDRLRDDLLAWWDTGLLDRYLRECDVGAMPRRPTVSLPWSATREVLPPDREAVLRLTAPRPPVVEPQADGGGELRMNGQRWRLTAGQLEAVRPLLDGEAWSVTHLCHRAAGAIDPAEARSLLVDLVLSGAVAVIDVEPEGEA